MNATYNLNFDNDIINSHSNNSNSNENQEYNFYTTKKITRNKKEIKKGGVTAFFLTKFKLIFATLVVISLVLIEIIFREQIRFNMSNSFI